MPTWPVIVPPSREAHRIVIVDDVPEIREILGFMLEESGWFRVVATAGTAAAAIAAAESRQPELVLLDEELPDRSGWDVIADLRRASPRSAVVVLSDSGAPAGPSRDGRELASAVIAKGTPNAELINRLLGVLGRSQFWLPDRDEYVPALPPTPATADALGWLRATLDASHDAVIGTTLDGVVVSWNAAAARLYGYPPEDMVGRSVHRLVPADRPDELPSFMARVATGESIDAFDTVRVHRDGTRLDVRLSVRPVVGAAGEVVGAVNVVRDVTATRHAEAVLARAVTQLDRRNRELARSNAELDSFAAVASHDLAQPLQVASGFLDMLAADYGDGLPAIGRQWLDASISSLGRMRDLVRDILHYARTGAGGPSLRPVRVRDVVGVALEALDAVVAERGAEIRIDLDDALEVAGDAGQLELVFQNLVANAVKFVPVPRTPRVRIFGEASEAEVAVHVVDNGIGIPAEQRVKVFDMFQRSSTTVEAGIPGTGLGLAIVKKIVLRHGGTVEAAEAPGGGAVVSVRLRPPMT